MEEKKKELINKLVKVRFPESDLAKLKTEYLNSNFNSFSRFCRAKLTGKYFLANEKSFAKLFTELSKVGSNINQISKSLNSVTYDFSHINFDVLKELKLIIQEIKNFQNLILEENT